MPLCPLLENSKAKNFGYLKCREAVYDLTGAHSKLNHTRPVIHSKSENDPWCPAPGHLMLSQNSKVQNFGSLKCCEAVYDLTGAHS